MPLPRPAATEGRSVRARPAARSASLPVAVSRTDGGRRTPPRMWGAMRLAGPSDGQALPQASQAVPLPGRAVPHAPRTVPVGQRWDLPRVGPGYVEACVSLPAWRTAGRYLDASRLAAPRRNAAMAARLLLPSCHV